MNVLTSNTSKSYNIYIGEDLIKDSAQIIAKDISFNKICVITDDIVAPLYLQKIIDSFGADNTVSFVVKNGEQAKNSTNLFDILNFLCENKITRSDLIVALGGGVIGDLAGFVASIYLRGVKFLQIPTTLLSQVDSSVGGKTAINIPHGKNLVGSFYMPDAVICDVNVLSTLSDKIFSDGMSEVIKYACILDEKLMDKINMLDMNNKDYSLLQSIISDCIRLKINVVEQDEHDTGLRMLLNFGHTFGHAIEKHFNFSKYTHGEAVAMGMSHITCLSEKLNLTQPNTTDKIISILEKFNLPTECELSEEELFALCGNDKKNLNNVINLILISNIGKSFIHKLSPVEFKEFLNA